MTWEPRTFDALTIRPPKRLALIVAVNPDHIIAPPVCGEPASVEVASV